LPCVKESLAHFVHTLKSAAVRRGWLDDPTSLLPGFSPSPEFEDSILAVLHEAGLLDRKSAVMSQESGVRGCEEM
jgi:hypothetical protein